MTFSPKEKGGTASMVFTVHCGTEFAIPRDINWQAYVRMWTVATKT